MRIIVCPHELAMGGSQINAIELAAVMNDRGHDVVVFAPDGVLAEKVAGLGLERVSAPDGTKLSIAWTRQLIRLAKDRETNLVHTYEWAPSLGAAYGLRSLLGTAQVMTVLSMDVPGFLPADIPLMVGTPELAAGLSRHRNIGVMEPPIDTLANRSTNVSAARNRWGIGTRELIVSVVCRMTDELDKANGVLSSIDAVDQLAERFPVRLLVVGEGPALGRIRARAASANAQHGRRVIDVVGHMQDPRDAYECADVVLGMGSSILRAMSFSKPVVVQGSQGYWELLTPDTADRFLWSGFYGSQGAGCLDLLLILERLLGSQALRSEFGTWNRDLVVSRFSLTVAADKLEELYHRTLAEPRRSGEAVLSLSMSMARLAKFRVEHALEQRAAS